MTRADGPAGTIAADPASGVRPGPHAAPPIPHTPPPPPRVARPIPVQRERGAGRPTKRERRQMNQLLED